jgi:hypothetical protein
VLPSIAAEKVAAGGFMVLRPDSGDPVEVVLMVSQRRWGTQVTQARLA